MYSAGLYGHDTAWSIIDHPQIVQYVLYLVSRIPTSKISDAIKEHGAIP
jgi:hypothetical protein